MTGENGRAKSRVQDQRRRKQAFLKLYAANANISAACRDLHMDTDTIYRWLQVDPAFAVAMERAHEQATDELEEAARKRALEDSDTLLIFLLKGNRPERYGDRRRIEYTTDEALVAQATSLAARIRELRPGVGGTRLLAALEGELVSDSEPDEIPE